MLRGVLFKSSAARNYLRTITEPVSELPGGKPVHGEIEIIDVDLVDSYVQENKKQQEVEQYAKVNPGPGDIESDDSPATTDVESDDPDDSDYTQETDDRNSSDSDDMCTEDEALSNSDYEVAGLSPAEISRLKVRKLKADKRLLESRLSNFVKVVRQVCDIPDEKPCTAATALAV